MAPSTGTATLHWLDNTVICGMLAITTAIGIYCGLFDGSEKSTVEYQLGGRRMRVVPIALSLLSNILPALQVMIEFPAETYTVGTKNLVIFIPVVVTSMAISGYAVLPVFYENGIFNVFTYLELRFSKSVRRLLTLSFVVCVLVDAPLMAYFPALQCAHFTGLNVHAINAVVCVVGVSYTLLGGLKAMVWTGVLQSVVMVVSLLVLTAAAIVRVGGLDAVWYATVDGDRLTVPPHTVNLTARQTVFSLSAYLFGMWMAIGLVQSFVQRIVALPTLRHARKSLVVFTAGNVLFIAGQSFLGLVMYTFYADCDPLQSGQLTQISQLVPQFVRDIVGHIGGMRGLFVSSLLCASLSTLSSYMVAFSGVIYEEFFEHRCCHKFTERTAQSIMQSIVLIIGVYTFLMGLFIEQSDWLSQIKLAKMNISAGAVFGVFTLGMFYPKAHSRPVLLGTLVAVVAFTWLMIGSRWYGSRVEDSMRALLPTSIEGCTDYNVSIAMRGRLDGEKLGGNATGRVPFSVYRISYDWYPVFVAGLVWLIAVPLSHMLKRTGSEKAVELKMLSPIVHRFVNVQLTDAEKKERKSDVYFSLPNNLLHTTSFKRAF